MTGADALADELTELRAMPDAQRRGYRFEEFVAKILRQDHFSVVSNAGVSRPRQVDALAVRGELIYLIETKWRRSKATVNDVDSLATRLQSTSPAVVGLLVSYSGFTPEAVARTEQKAQRPIALVTGEELENSLWPGDFVRLLRRKIESLMTHRSALFVATNSMRPLKPARGGGGLPTSRKAIAFPDGRRSGSFVSGGDFGSFVFLTDLPDIDWVPSAGFGVTLDIPGTAQHFKDLERLVHDLNQLGWMTGGGRWSIQQAEANWHGSGAKEFVAAVANWRGRYRSLSRVHHTEEFCYFDICEGGFYTMAGQISADARRQVWHLNLSFQLAGIPIEQGPLRQLCLALDPPVGPVFRPRSERSVELHGVPMNQRPTLSVIGFLVERDALDPAQTEWVTGIVAKNPYHSERRPPSWWPPALTGSELLLCDLRSWHPLSSAKRTYRLWSIEWAWTSDAVLLRPRADWDDRRSRHRQDLIVIEVQRPPKPRKPRVRSRTANPPGTE